MRLSKAGCRLRLFGWALLLGSALILLSQPRWMFQIATQLRPGAIYAFELPVSPRPPKVVALTIDDGPSEATAEILSVLDRYGVTATFFNISGNLPGHEPTVHEAIAAGHELGNHLTADEPSIRLSPADFETDLLTAEKALLPYLNQGMQNKGAPPSGPSRLRWLRPGMGFYNAQMVATAEKHGYQLVLGSNFPYDTHILSSRFASVFVTRTIQPGDIIVLHDGQGRGPRTVATLERILPALQAKGYTVTTVTALEEMSLF
ncbi:MAG: chitin deacetylase family protein [Cyanobacteria bacterium J06649_5]